MPDTHSSYSTPVVNTTISNATVTTNWASWSVYEYESGLIKFVDADGNTVHSRQKSLRKFLDAMKEAMVA